ncbi:MAG: hypothetical protein ACYS47_17660 [Planctomycetota bacterium]|jgi:hypothetical protein
MARILRIAAPLVLALLFFATTAGHGASKPKAFKVALKSADLPLSSFKTVSVGVTIRSAPVKDTPRGYDTLFDFQVGGQLNKKGKIQGGVQVRILHKGWKPESAKLFWQRPRGAPVPLDRIEKPISSYYLPFGPLQLRGVPPFTLHFYFPKTNVDSWKARSKSLYLLPARCMSGEARLNGRTYTVALLDRTLNGKWGDPCTEHSREGDWFLFDENQDKTFTINLMRSEGRGLTRCIPLAGHVWTVQCRGKQAYFKPVKLPDCRVELRGLAESATVTGWSQATGDISAPLDKEGGIEIARDKFHLYSYSWTKEKWRLTASLRKLGVHKAPSSGLKTFEVGPTLACSLTKTNQGEDMKFSFKCSGRAGESVTPYKDGKRIEPVFVITRSGGKEVLRQAGKFG